jgi:hypothetical protein
MASPAERIAKLLRESIGDEFEKVVRDAFGFLGFESKWIGNIEGDADVLASSVLAGKPYRVVCECSAVYETNKVKNEKIGQILSNGPKHKKDYENLYLVVVGRPKFSEVAIKNAGSDVTLLMAEDLAQLVLNHGYFTFSNDDLEIVFLPTTGLASPVVESLIESFRCRLTDSLYIYSLLCLVAEKFTNEQGGGTLRIEEHLLISTAQVFGEALGIGIFSFEQIRECFYFLASPMAHIFAFEQDSNLVVFRGVSVDRALSRLGWIGPPTLDLLNQCRKKLSKALQQAKSKKAFPF